MAPVAYFGALRELPITAVEPRGWVRSVLEAQREGLTGHLDDVCFPFAAAGWGRPQAPLRYDNHHVDEWWPYEQTGYWIDGMVRTALLLRDDALLAKARGLIDPVLANPDGDGYLGPPFLKAPERQNRWAHAVFFRALAALQSASADRTILESVVRHYRSGTSPHTYAREVANVETMVWAYLATGDDQLLVQAREAYAGYARRSPESQLTPARLASGGTLSEHGVSFCEVAKLGAVLYLATGDGDDLGPSVSAFRTVARDQLLVDGVPSSSEHLRGREALDSHETCVIADYTWSLGFLLLATGDARYADGIEQAVFNAAAGAITPDFRALQYFSCPNQVVSDASSNHNRFRRGGKWMSYRPNPGTECCAGNVNRIFPNYAARMWLADRDGYPVLALLGPSRLQTMVPVVTAAGGREDLRLALEVETGYPFSEAVVIRVQPERPAVFSVSVRIPHWCSIPEVRVNGVPTGARPEPGTFVALRREYRQGDEITMAFPMELRVSRWPGGGVGVHRGPLAYALPIDEEWERETDDGKSTDAFPAWRIRPRSAWNYALLCDEDGRLERAEVVRNLGHAGRSGAGGAAALPSILSGPVDGIRVRAVRVPRWETERPRRILSQRYSAQGLRDFDVGGEFAFTPPLPERRLLDEAAGGRVESVTLVPYGCTRLRIAVFPTVVASRGA